MSLLNNLWQVCRGQIKEQSDGSTSNDGYRNHCALIHPYGVQTAQVGVAKAMHVTLDRARPLAGLLGSARSADRVDPRKQTVLACSIAESMSTLR